MIKNEYIIENGIVIFTITRRNGDEFKVKIDENQLYKIDNLNLKIHVNWFKKINNYYAELCSYLGTFEGKPKYETLLLHRIVADAKPNEYIDHKNPSETLDNTLSNLRVSRMDENSKNRKGKNKNNSTGYRNVSWINGEQKYIVQLQIDGKNTRLGKFDNAEEAGEFAEEMRIKYYGEFAGNN